MAIMAQWLSKTFEVSARRITALTGITTGLALETEKNDDADGSAATNVRGYTLRTLPITVKYGVAAGTSDVRGEYESWEALVGTYAPFYLAGRRLGAKKYLLSQVKASDIVLSNSGRWLECTVSITLEEYADEAAKAKATPSAAAKGTGTKKASAIQTRVSTYKAKSAKDVGPSTSDKATHKVAEI